MLTKVVLSRCSGAIPGAQSLSRRNILFSLYHGGHFYAQKRSDSTQVVPAQNRPTPEIPKSTKRSWSEAEDDVIMQLHVRKGLTMEQTAAHLPARTFTAVLSRWAKSIRPRIPKADIPLQSQASGGQGRAWQEDEDALIVQMRKRGVTWHVIANDLRRAISSTYNRAQRLVAIGKAPASIIVPRKVRLGPEHDATILTCLRKDMSFPQIGAELGGIHPSTVYHRFHRQLMTDPAVRREFNKKRVQRRLFSQAEDEAILRAHDEGRPLHDLAADLGRKRDALRARLWYMKTYFVGT